MDAYTFASDGTMTTGQFYEVEVDWSKGKISVVPVGELVDAPEPMEPPC